MFFVEGKKRMISYEHIAEYTFMLFVAIAIIAGFAVGYMAYNATLHWYDPAVADTNGYITLLMLILGITV